LWTSVPLGGWLLAGLGRSASYAAAARGELPVIRVGRRLVVSLPRLAETLGVSLDDLLALERALPDEPASDGRAPG
jgi:hypothetical protein